MLYLFWLSVAAVLTSYIGYPLVLLLLKKQPSRPGDFAPPVTLVISAYNEEKVIQEKLENTLSLDYPRDKLQILVVSDGSTDSTHDLVQTYREEGVELIIVTGRQGKTFALNQVIPKVKHDIIIFSDANSIYQPQAIRQLIRHFADPQVGAVCGELVFSASTTGTGHSEGLYWRYEQFLKKLESQTGKLTTFNGAIYALKKELHRPMIPAAANDFQHALQAALTKFKTIYEPSAVAIEPPGESARVEFRRRVRIINRGWNALTAYPAVLNPIKSGTFALKFFLHKLLRWLGPVFMLLALVSNLFILGPLFYNLSLAAQTAFYFLAALSTLGLRSKITGLPGHFAIINLAALLALFNVLRGKKAATWTPTSHAQTAKGRVNHAD